MDIQDLEQLNPMSLLEHANVAVVIHKLDTSIVYANPLALKLLQLNYRDAIGTDAHDPQWYFVDEFGNRLAADEYPVNKVLQHQETLKNEFIGHYDIETQEVSWFLVNAYLEPGSGADAGEGFIVVTFNDVSDQRHLFSYHDIIENTQDIILVTEAQNLAGPLGPKIVYVNKAFEVLTGYSASEVIGETPRILQGKGTDESALKKISEALQAQEPVRETILNYSKTGKPYWLDLNIFPLKNKFGKVTHFAAIERDVTETMFQANQLEKSNADLKALKDELQRTVESQTKKLQEANWRLTRLAYYDELTGIPNRRSFYDQAEQIAGLSQRGNYSLVVGLLDIDHFKAVNDKYGHDVGDKALKYVATTLKKRFRREDAFGRIGGEEFGFAILMDSAENAEIFCERLRKEIKSTPMAIAEHRFDLTVSIGFSVCTPGQKCSLQDLLKEADQALYQAKKEGRDRIKAF